MGKLGSFAKQNKIAKALKEMGNIEKTIFILNYIMDEDFRRRVQRGLNKGEAINSLARALFFGKLGILREFSIKNQFQRAAALNILINAISIWNTVYLNKAITELKQRNVKMIPVPQSAVEAEKSVYTAPRTCVFYTRYALERAVHWLYQHDSYLQKPYQDTLAALIHEQTFKDNLSPGLFDPIRFIHKLG
jgi:hypothetical protein